MTSLDVVVLGRGKVGRTLGLALRRAGVRVRLAAGRTGTPRPNEVVLLAVPDAAIVGVAKRLALCAVKARPRSVLHCAGALGPEVLAPLADVAIPVAQFHPLASFARPFGTALAGVHARIAGDRRAMAAGRRICRVLGMVPLEGPVDPAAYHAAAALVSNGAVALVAAAIELLGSSGLHPRVAARALGPLLRTTARNVETLGLPEALTGPVRRGDAHTVAQHLAILERRAPEALPLYRELVSRQLLVARDFPVEQRASRAALAEVADVVDLVPSARRRSRNRS
jgi:predicted short-subunit dehydrogenase-like oxidoreductase (DUF2520 family)